MITYKCKECGNDTRFWHECSLKAKIVFNQKTGKEYIIDRSDEIDNYFEGITHCYDCNEVV